MAVAETEEDDDAKPKENGSDAVERRIEKVMSEMRDRGLIDVNDDVAYEAKKVKLNLPVSICFAVTDVTCPLFRRRSLLICILPTCGLRLTHVIIALL